MPVRNTHVRCWNFPVKWRGVSFDLSERNIVNVSWHLSIERVVSSEELGNEEMSWVTRRTRQAAKKEIVELERTVLCPHGTPHTMGSLGEDFLWNNQLDGK